MNAAIDAFLFLPLKENIPNFKMKLFFVLALVVMSFGGLNAAVIPEEMVNSDIVIGSVLSTKSRICALGS